MIDSRAYAGPGSAAVDFLPSLAIGILIVTPVFFCLYFSALALTFGAREARRSLNFHARAAALPGVLTGVFWGCGNFTSFFATAYLGQAIGFPLTQTCGELPYLILSYLILSYLILSYLILCYAVTSHHIAPHPIPSHPIPSHTIPYHPNDNDDDDDDDDDDDNSHRLRPLGRCILPRDPGMGHRRVCRWRPHHRRRRRAGWKFRLKSLRCFDVKFCMSRSAASTATVSTEMKIVIM